MKILNSDRKNKVDKLLKDYLDDIELDEWLSEGPILPPIRINLLPDDDEEKVDKGSGI